MQGIVDQLEPEASAQHSTHAQHADAHRDSAACSAKEPEANDMVTQCEMASDPQSGETQVQFWSRQFTHVRNKGRKQIQVRTTQHH